MEPESPDPYEVLGVPPTASQGAIQAAYRQLVKRVHPDVPGTGDREAFIRVQAAFRQIGDAEKRVAYDQSRRNPQRPAWRPTETALGFTRAVSWRGPRFIVPALAVATVLALVQVAALFARPGVVAVPTPWQGAPPMAAAAPERGAGGAAPVQPGPFTAADHFVSAGPSLPWAGGMGRLEPFTPVALVRPVGADGRARVRAADGAEGPLDAARLMAGDSRAARLAACLHGAGGPPRGGQVLARQGSGTARLAVENREDRPAVVKLRDADGTRLAAIYLAPRGQATLENLPERSVRVEFAQGDLWSAACGRFTAGMRAQALPNPLALSATSRLSLPATGNDIADDDFARD